MNFMKKIKIRKRLGIAFGTVVTIMSIVAATALIVILALATEYNYTLTNYALPQGDIGKAMAVFSEIRSTTRAVIGFDEESTIEEAFDKHEEKKEELDAYLATIKETTTTEQGLALYEELETKLKEYYEIEEEVHGIGKTTDREKCEEAQDLEIAELDPVYDEVYEIMGKLMDDNVSSAIEMQQKMYQNINMMVMVIIVGLVIALLYAFGIARLIAKSVAIPVAQMSKRLKAFKEGDLESPFPAVDTTDEVSEMVEEAEAMAKKLHLIVNDVNHLMSEMAEGNFRLATEVEDEYVGEFKELLLSVRKMNRQMSATLKEVDIAAYQVSEGAGNMAEAAQALAGGATDQAASVEEMQATIENVAEGVEQTASNVERSYEQAQKYAIEAEKGRTEMEAMMEAMNNISKTSKKVQNIIEDIEDIASQTNLLSLNAAIEAARAGEAGKGFAVVADQIRTLAEQSAKSAVDTRELIEGSIQEIEDGNKVAARASEALGQVVDGVKQIAETSKRLSRVAEEQAVAMKQVESGVERISEIVQSNSATAEETSATSEELSAQAISMNELVGRFQLRDE